MDARRSGRRKSKKNNNLDVHKLSKGQKKHLKEFGELHPIDDKDFDTVNKSSNVKRRRIETIIDDSLKSRRKRKTESETIDDDVKHELEHTKVNEEDEVDNEEEISPYQRLIHSLSAQQTKKDKTKIMKKTEKQPHLEENEGLDDNEVELEDDMSGSDDDIELSMNGQTTDPFSLHFENDLDDIIIKKLEESENSPGKPVKTSLKNGVASYYPPLPEINYPVEMKHSEVLEKVWVKERLCKRWRQMKNTSDGGCFTSLQQEIFPIINSYQDCFYTGRNFTNADEIREIYCLHALNHILKTRSRILKNNAKIVQCQKDNKELDSELRDQGLTRPKVLILVPFRHSALQVVQILLKLLAEPGEEQVMNKKRFLEEFESKESESDIAQNKPDDFKQTFAGNIDDFFRVGLVVMRKAVKLFTEFYSSDIIIASPVGLRAIIGAEGEKKRDFDFLSSIEVLIMDQTDIFLMQNWEHIHHIFDHLHIQPKDAHEVDFSRVRMWNLNGWSKFYRQNIIFSGFMSPEINFVFNKHCHNYCGKTKILPANNTGSICQVASQIPQVFQKVIASSHKEVSGKRFEYFTDKIFPELKDTTGFMSNTAIFVSSYFDFVRIRNYLKKHEVDFFQLSEYTTRANISCSRQAFLQGQKPILLFTERFYFYYRYQIRGIKNIYFYELPYYPRFYTEIVNYMDRSSLQVGNDETSSCNATVLYTKFDCHKLSRIVGELRCQQMLKSEQTVHMFVTGD